VTNSAAGGYDTGIQYTYNQDQLVQAMARYGNRWDIRPPVDEAGWAAAEKTQTSPHTLHSLSLGGLVFKLKGA
jgi:hypothetical protein